MNKQSLLGFVMVVTCFGLTGCPPDSGDDNGGDRDPEPDTTITDTDEPDAAPDTGLPDDTDPDGQQMSDTSPDGGLSAPTVADFNEKFGDLLQRLECERRWSCPKRYAGSILQITKYEDLQTCKQGDSANRFYGLLFGSGDFEYDLENGRIEYNAQLASQCLDQVDDFLDSWSPNCSAPLPEPADPECTESNFFEGQVEMGGSCRADLACADGLECEWPENTCGGQCVEPDDSNDDGNQQAGTTCQSDSDCGDGLTCAPDPDNQSQEICAQANDRVPGAPCSGATECEPQSTCSEEQCVEYTILSQGVSCTTAFDRTEVCEPGLTCVVQNDQSGTCEPYLDAGDSCTENSECRAQFQCIDGECKTPKSPGESCSLDSECASGTCRSNDICAPFGREACWPDP